MLPFPNANAVGVGIPAATTSTFAPLTAVGGGGGPSAANGDEIAISEAAVATATTVAWRFFMVSSVGLDAGTFRGGGCGTRRCRIDVVVSARLRGDHASAMAHRVSDPAEEQEQAKHRSRTHRGVFPLEPVPRHSGRIRR